MYLDTDPILALLKSDDWLASEVDLDAIDEPHTSVATGIEVQYVLEDDWTRNRLVGVHEEISDLGVELVDLTPRRSRPEPTSVPGTRGSTSSTRSTSGLPTSSTSRSSPPTRCTRRAPRSNTSIPGTSAESRPGAPGRVGLK